jgi:uncharacterized membrane protein
VSKNTKLVALIFDEGKRASIIVGSGAAVTPIEGSAPDQAMAVLESIQKSAKGANVKLEDAVVVFKNLDGEVKIKQTKDITAGKGAGWGSLWGLIVGLIFGGPIVGALLGLAIGAIYGGAVDHGIDDKFLKNVGNSLGQTDSAVLILIREEDYEDAIAYLKSFETEIYEADISAEAEATLHKAVENDKVAKTVEAEYSAD